MRAAALALAVLSLAGCKTYCRQLSEKVCDCTTSSSERTSCLSTQATKEGSVGPDPVTQEQEDFCETKLSTCDCRLIDTPAGRERCGLAN